MTDSGLAILPGIATASEALELLERDIQIAKFLPAAGAAGTRILGSLLGPFPEVRVCPTGGIDEQNAVGYLAMQNVPCVGGSWIVPHEAIEGGDWQRVETLAIRAAALVDVSYAA